MTVGSQVVTEHPTIVDLRSSRPRSRPATCSCGCGTSTWSHAVLRRRRRPEIRRWNPRPLRRPRDRTRSSPASSCVRAVDRAPAGAGTKHATWAVCDATSGQVLGYVSLHDLQPRHLAGEVGYWVLPGPAAAAWDGASVAAAVGYALRRARASTGSSCSTPSTTRRPAGWPPAPASRSRASPGRPTATATASSTTTTCTPASPTDPPPA